MEVKRKINTPIIPLSRDIFDKFRSHLFSMHIFSIIDLILF